jgi:hypothetical protein
MGSSPWGEHGAWAPTPRMRDGNALAPTRRGLAGSTARPSPGPYTKPPNSCRGACQGRALLCLPVQGAACRSRGRPVRTAIPLECRPPPAPKPPHTTTPRGAAANATTGCYRGEPLEQAKRGSLGQSYRGNSKAGEPALGSRAGRGGPPDGARCAAKRQESTPRLWRARARARMRAPLRRASSAAGCASSPQARARARSPAGSGFKKEPSGSFVRCHVPHVARMWVGGC